MDASNHAKRGGYRDQESVGGAKECRHARLCLCVLLAETLLQSCSEDFELAVEPAPIKSSCCRQQAATYQLKIAREAAKELRTGQMITSERRW